MNIMKFNFKLKTISLTLLYSKDNMFHHFVVCNNIVQIDAILDQLDLDNPDLLNNGLAFLEFIIH